MNLLVLPIKVLTGAHEGVSVLANGGGEMVITLRKYAVGMEAIESYPELYGGMCSLENLAEMGAPDDPEEDDGAWCEVQIGDLHA